MLSAYVALELWDVKKMGLAQPMKPGKSHDSFAARKKAAGYEKRDDQHANTKPAGWISGRRWKFDQTRCGGRGKRDAGCAVGILGSNVNQPWKIPFPVTYSRVKPSWNTYLGPYSLWGMIVGKIPNQLVWI